jgi:hypothetical protein
MYYRFILFFAVGCFIFNGLVAQLDGSSLTGKVLLRNGQTLKGYIKGDPIQKMNYRILFKDSLAANKFITYDTAVVNAVYIDNGEVYELLHFKMDDQPDSQAVLGNLAVSGTVKLYRVYYGAKIIFLLKNSERTFVLQDDELISPSAVDVIKHNFKNQLDTAFKHNSKYIDDINNLSYNERELIALVSKYNEKSGSGNTVLKTKGEKANFLIFGIADGIEPSGGNDFNLGVHFRAYFPRISKGSSLNIGLNYYHNSGDELFSNFYYFGAVYYNTYLNYSGNLISVPVTIQENVLNKNVRPYLMAGVSGSYYKGTYENGVKREMPGYVAAANYRFSWVYGVGIEANFYKGLMAKAVYQYETYNHHILIGIAYALRTK